MITETRFLAMRHTKAFGICGIHVNDANQGEGLEKWRKDMSHCSPRGIGMNSKDERGNACEQFIQWLID